MEALQLELVVQTRENRCLLEWTEQPSEDVYCNGYIRLTRTGDGVLVFEAFREKDDLTDERFLHTRFTQEDSEEDLLNNIYFALQHRGYMSGVAFSGNQSQAWKQAVENGTVDADTVEELEQLVGEVLGFVKFVL